MMKKYSERLIKSMLNGDRICKMGNHKMEKDVEENYYFRFNGWVILHIDVENKVIFVGNSHYNKSKHTKNVVNSHLEAVKEFLDWKNYIFVEWTENMEFKYIVENMFGEKCLNIEEYEELCKLNY